MKILQEEDHEVHLYELYNCLLSIYEHIHGCTVRGSM